MQSVVKLKQLTIVTYFSMTYNMKIDAVTSPV